MHAWRNVDARRMQGVFFMKNARSSNWRKKIDERVSTYYWVLHLICSSVLRPGVIKIKVSMCYAEQRWLSTLRTAAGVHVINFCQLSSEAWSVGTAGPHSTGPSLFENHKYRPTLFCKNHSTNTDEIIYI